MRKATILISERDFIRTIAGIIYDMAPRRLPRKIETIMTHVVNHFRQDAHNNNEWYSMQIARDDVHNYVKSVLESISEYHELNLTQIEFDKGVKVDDPNRGGIRLSSRYDVYTKDSWKDDFIDLDALTGNIAVALVRCSEEEDCFLCRYRKNKEKCSDCYINPNYKNNYESLREPKGERTFACKYNCYRSYYICCEECDDKDSCDKRCDGNSQSCGNVWKK